MELKKGTAKDSRPANTFNLRLYYCLSLLVISSFFSCTSATTNPAYSPSIDTSEYKRIIDAQTHLFSEEIKLVAEIDLLTNHPGWGDFVPVIKSMPSIAYLEGQAAAFKTNQTAIKSWSEKWHAPGEELYRRYLTLGDRSKNLHMKRRDLHAQEVDWIESYYSEGLKKASLIKDKNISTRMVEEERGFRERSLRRAHLMNNVLGLGPIGLYERKVSQEELQRILTYH